jgi:NAD(P)-dependent dehydrogenase (short-subunit alcohol dehydrogenase family)
MFIVNLILYAICIFREFVVRAIQLVIGDPLSRLKSPFWYYAPYPESVNELPVCIVTGGGKGIGWHTALNLAKSGTLRVIVTVRDEKNIEIIKSELRTLSGNPNVDVLPLDLCSFASIRAFAQIIQDRDLPIQILIHNAGGLGGKTREMTEDGFERSWQANYLGPFYLTKLLMGNLKKANPAARVITVSSVAHVFGNIDMTDLAYLRTKYHTARAYCDGKLAALLFSKELQRRFEKEGRADMYSVSLHPGLVASEFYDRYIPKKYLFAFKSVPSGARTQTYLALAPPSQLERGGYYSECILAPHSFVANDHVISDLLWDETEKLVNIKLMQK